MTEVHPIPPIIFQISKARWEHRLKLQTEPSEIFLGRSDYEALRQARPGIDWQWNGKEYDGLKVHRTELENELRVL